MLLLGMDGKENVRLEWIDEDVMRRKAQDAGFHIATWGERDEATHAVCRHGRIVTMDTDSHICQWWPLVANGVKIEVRQFGERRRITAIRDGLPTTIWDRVPNAGGEGRP